MEDLAKVRTKIKKHLAAQFETFLDVTEIVEELINLFEDCAKVSLELDLTRVPDLTKLYLDCVVIYFDTVVILSRIRARKLILCLLMHATPTVGPGAETVKRQFKKVCDFLGPNHLNKPLHLAYETFKPFLATLKPAFLSSLCMAYYAKLKSSSLQWRKEDFLTIRNLVETTGEKKNTN